MKKLLILLLLPLSLAAQWGPTQYWSDTLYVPKLGIHNDSLAFTFPMVDGVNGQFLKTDGAGNVTWGAGLTNPTTDTLILKDVAGDTDSTMLHQTGGSTYLEATDGSQIYLTAPADINLQPDGVTVTDAFKVSHTGTYIRLLGDASDGIQMEAAWVFDDDFLTAEGTNAVMNIQNNPIRNNSGVAFTIGGTNNDAHLQLIGETDGGQNIVRFRALDDNGGQVIFALEPEGPVGSDGDHIQMRGAVSYYDTTTVTAASTLTLDSYYNVFRVQGTTAINSIDVASTFPEFGPIHLYFISNVNVNPGNNIHLGHKFFAENTDMLTLMRVGDQFMGVGEEYNNQNHDTTSVASASTIELTSYSRFYLITGTTTIDSISTDSRFPDGEQAVFKTADAVTWTDGKNLFLSGNETLDADDILVLTHYNDNWYRTSSSNN